MNTSEELLTLRDWLRWAVTRFHQAQLHFGHGSDNAFDEAAYLIAHTLALPLERFDTFLDARLTQPEKNQLRQILDRRIEERVPAAYLTQEAWLGDFRFYIDERVIIPRSFIAELMPDGLSPYLLDRHDIKNALDLCTGSGCLAILLADAYPNAEIDAVDISPQALAVAQRNINDYHLSDRITLIRSNYTDDLPSGKRYDLIISNPPYVTGNAMQNLPREYRHEPELALAGGADGLDAVHHILKNAPYLLTPHGIVVVEIGHNRALAEAAYPNLPFVWLDTGSSEESVFLLTREDFSGFEHLEEGI
ncbi:MAG: 50S ribosomal protein L3 N(5)-glutamine methyltransferase [Burkholderiales bacterium]|jgi:ribosomal protein L3 glutamine methyltransferase|nr:50S ribosomal protein L3 N(5)-glutamine methyltransferase [Burkholderiales bacterium]